MTYLNDNVDGFNKQKIIINVSRVDNFARISIFTIINSLMCDSLFNERSQQNLATITIFRIDNCNNITKETTLRWLIDEHLKLEF